MFSRKIHLVAIPSKAVSISSIYIVVNHTPKFTLL